MPTKLAADEGRMRRTERKTRMAICEPLLGESAAIYELGIPLVEVGDGYHVDVLQKFPLTFDRTNVPPA
jgi:hypothetical protein